MYVFVVNKFPFFCSSECKLHKFRRNASGAKCLRCVQRCVKNSG